MPTLNSVFGQLHSPGYLNSIVYVKHQPLDEFLPQYEGGIMTLLLSDRLLPETPVAPATHQTRSFWQQSRNQVQVFYTSQALWLSLFIASKGPLLIAKIISPIPKLLLPRQWWWLWFGSADVVQKINKTLHVTHDYFQLHGSSCL